MKLKKLLFIAMFLSTPFAYAANIQLNEYETIKYNILNGATIQMVVNLKNDCKLTYDYTNGGPTTSFNTLIRLLTDFSIKEQTNNIMWMRSITGDGDGNDPLNYQISVMNILPNNQVNLEFKIIALLNHKLIKDTRFLCRIESKNSNGIKFFINQRL